MREREKEIRKEYGLGGVVPQVCIIITQLNEYSLGFISCGFRVLGFMGL
jgi:hypothetical protein